MLEYGHQLRGLLGTEMVHEHEGLKVALCLEFLCRQHAAKSMTKIGEGASCITHHVISWAWERRKVIQVLFGPLICEVTGCPSTLVEVDVNLTRQDWRGA